MTRRTLTGLAALLALVLVAPAGASAAPPCVRTDAAPCLLPWPNDLFTRADRSSPTGRRLALAPEAMPRNVDGVPIDPTPYNASDGFSPGQTIVAKVPGLDTPAAFARTGLVPQTDLARHRDVRQPAVVIDAETGRRHLIWAELDSNAPEAADRALLIHPAKNWLEGRRYIVALRRLRDADGRLIEPDPTFRAYRDRRRGGDPARRAQMEQIFRRLARAGISRRELHSAWDFTVASAEGLSKRMLSIRDRAFAGLGDTDLDDLRVAGTSPAFRVDSVEEYTEAEQPNVARRVFGTVTVPCYLDRPGCPSGARFALDGDGLPVRSPGNVYEASFICNVPRSASPGRPARPSLYGHGLFGDAGEIFADNVEQLGQENNVLVCAANWIGMSEEDIGGVALPLLLDFSKFPALPDRVQQGYLNFLFLGRAMIHPQGLGSHPAFRAGGRPVIDDRRLFYYGNSQGGIAGGALTAIAPDFTRSVLYVGATNYSLLIQRSVDFDPFAAVFEPRYPSPLERQLVVSMIQLLWDRGEPNGYAQHMTDDPYPDTPRHEVLQILSFGDHQVANVATEVQARTIGSRLRVPAVDPGRHTDRRPYYRIPRLRNPRRPGPAALVVWDIGPLRPAGSCPEPDEETGRCGTPAPPAANLAPRTGVDPHDLVIESEADARRQIAEWISLPGRLVDPCGREPCHAAGWEGPE